MNKYTIVYDTLLGEGVDGKIHKAKLGDLEIVVKIMDNQFVEKEQLDSFILINKLAGEKGIGPVIFDIDVKDNLIYLFMEKLDGTIDDYVKQRLDEGKTFNSVVEDVKNKIKRIHQQLEENKITIEENNSDNYMFKGDTIKRIDFTKSEIKDVLSGNDRKLYKFLHIINPITKENLKINLFN